MARNAWQVTAHTCSEVFVVAGGEHPAAGLHELDDVVVRRCRESRCFSVDAEEE